jgi:tetratricopeptide (TPR) repeat protein
MDLSRFMDIFMPLYQGGKEDFIMASHVERLKESKCFISAGDELNCTYCHVAHKSFREVDKQVFIRQCISCHNGDGKVCTAPEKNRLEKDDYCITCHMEVSLTRDIPHVRIHDHKIAIPPTPEELASERRFMGLISVNNPGTDDLSMAKGYLLEYEAYNPKGIYLDSAYKYLRKAGWLDEPENLNAVVNYYYLRKDHLAIAGLVELNGISNLLNHILVNKEYSNYDAWTAYRIGQALEAQGNIDQAVKFYEKAVELATYNLEFRNKLGSILVARKDLGRAQEIFEFILSEYPLYASAHVNYGYTVLLLGDLEKAEKHYDFALSLDPDQVQALLNKAGLCFLRNERDQGMFYIERVLTLEPDNPQANLVKERFNQAIR